MTHGLCVPSINLPCLSVAEGLGGGGQAQWWLVPGLVCSQILLEEMEEEAAVWYSHCTCAPRLLLVRGHVPGDCLDHWVNTPVPTTPGRRSDLG